jgi:hypothetical protein
MAIAASDLQARLPDVTSSLTAEPLDDEVTIVRDSFGVRTGCASRLEFALVYRSFLD